MSQTHGARGAVWLRNAHALCDAVLGVEFRRAFCVRKRVRSTCALCEEEGGREALSNLEWDMNGAGHNTFLEYLPCIHALRSEDIRV